MEIKASPKVRFEEDLTDLGAENYSGYSWELVGDSQTYSLKTYDDDPGVISVRGESLLLQKKDQLGPIIKYLLANEKPKSIKVYSGEHGHFVSIDLQTLEVIDER